MKKLIVCVVCGLLALSAQAQQKTQKKTQKQRVSAGVDRQVNKAKQNVRQKTQQTAPQNAKKGPTIPGEGRLVSVRLEIQDSLPNNQVLRQTWNCPAVIYTQDGALAFHKECGQAIEQASAKEIGPSIHFFVDLSNLGEYTKGENQGKPFYFESSYAVGDWGDDEFQKGDNDPYIRYGKTWLSENSEVKAALAKYYEEQGLKAVTRDKLKQYFSENKPSKHDDIIPFR